MDIDGCEMGLHCFSWMLAFLLSQVAIGMGRHCQMMEEGGLI